MGVTVFIDHSAKACSVCAAAFGDSERVAPSEEGLVIDARAAWDWLTKGMNVWSTSISAFKRLTDAAFQNEVSMRTRLPSWDTH